MRDAKRNLLLMLEGVGQGKGILHLGKEENAAAVHLRRSLSDEEIGVLSPAWLAIPAEHEFTRDGEIEMEL
jgi:hypothetical protein